jgi:uncharacterized membrane protein YdbT with pleckstrin-like domain
MIALHPNERILGSYRKAWIVFLTTVLLAFFLFLAPLILFFLSRFISFLPPLPLSIASVIVTLWWWIVWTGSFIAFTNYYLDVFVVTNERIMHIEQLGLFRRRIAELRLERIQDVTIEQFGFLATMLHFGTIRVQTAAETEEFVFSSIPEPMRVKELIMAAQREAVIRDRAATT